jgi:hypothetical protein
MDKIAYIMAILILIIAFIAVLGAVTMLLWNWLMPAIFGFTIITFWQALGINLLSMIIFKSPHVNKS